MRKPRPTPRAGTETEIVVGTRVAFSRVFLQAIMAYSGRKPALRGKVIEEKSPHYVVVLWDDGDKQMVNVGNLVREDRLHLEKV